MGRHGRRITPIWSIGRALPATRHDSTRGIHNEFLKVEPRRDPLLGLCPHRSMVSARRHRAKELHFTRWNAWHPVWGRGDALHTIGIPSTLPLPGTQAPGLDHALAPPAAHLTHPVSVGTSPPAPCITKYTPPKKFQPIFSNHLYNTIPPQANKLDIQSQGPPHQPSTPTMATKKPNPFEKSSKDKEPKGMKEGSKKEVALDKKQAKPSGFVPFKKGGK